MRMFDRPGRYVLSSLACCSVVLACACGDDAAASAPDAGNAGNAGDAGKRDDGWPDAGAISMDAGNGGLPPLSMENWPSFGGGPMQSNASPSVGISSENVRELGLSWKVNAPGVTCTPIVYDGIVYWTDWGGGVHANHIEDGQPVWEKQYARGFTSTPLVTQDRVYLSDRDARMRALDRETGEEIWTTTVDEGERAQLWSSPMLVDGILMVGMGGKGTQNSGADIAPDRLMKFRGALFGLDAQSGKVKWRLETTKVGEMMFGAGAAVWSSTAIDEKLGLAFIGTGNSYYAPASPLSDSLLAVDYKTGELQWVHQFTANDNFTAGAPTGPDSDVGAAPNLFTSNGKDFVGVGDKAGSYYVFVRDTGEPAWSKKLTFGGSAGGVMGTAATANDTIFVISNQNFREAHIFALRADSGLELWKKVYPGMTFGHPVVVGDLLFATTSNISGTSTTKPKMFALSTNDGEEVWAHALPNSAAGGASVVGSRLLTGHGFHFFNDSREPLPGGLAVFNIGEMAEPDTDAGVDAARTMAPTFDAVYREVLEPSGCTTTYCHGSGGKLAMMDRASAYGNLVNADAKGELCAKSGLKRVVPGKPNESMLYLKLLENPPCGVRMPVAGKLPLEDIEQIKAWITLGAMND